jgi:hypothetical protein
MAVKQVFETYVYDLGLSSVHPTPFVLMQVMGRHGHACGGMPHQKDMQKIQREGMWQCGAYRGERACPALGCAAAPINLNAVYQVLPGWLVLGPLRSPTRGKPARHNKPARHEGPRVEGVRD